MSKELEVKIEYDANCDGYSGHFGGYRMFSEIQISDYETVEEIIGTVQKTLKNKRNAWIEFYGSCSDAFEQDVLFSRTVATGMHDRPIEHYAFWKNGERVTNGCRADCEVLPDVGKKTVKGIVLNAIKAYREFCEA